MITVYKVVGLIVLSTLFALGIHCSYVLSDDELAISEFDRRPNLAPLVDYIQEGDSLIVCFSSSELGKPLEYAVKLTVDDYSAATIFAPYERYDTIIFGNLSDNLKAQQWRLTLTGRYCGNISYVDTLHRDFSVQHDSNAVQISPSYIYVNPLHDPKFYVDINLDEVKDSILAGGLQLGYNSQVMKCDSVAYLKDDSLFYFNAGKGMLIHKTFIDSVHNRICLDFAFGNGLVDGLPGSGKVIRVFFTAQRPSITSMFIKDSRVKDINNTTLYLNPSSATIHITYMEN